MTRPTFNMSSEAKKAGWFSRRHQSSAPHFAAREAYQGRKQAQLEAAHARQQEADARKVAATAKKSDK